MRVTGTLIPAAQVEIKSRLSGTVESVAPAAVLGARVEKDEVLARLDASTYKAQLAWAGARVTATERDLAAQEMMFKAGAVAQKEVVNATASLDAARADLATARANGIASVYSNDARLLSAARYFELSGSDPAGK